VQARILRDERNLQFSQVYDRIKVNSPEGKSNASSKISRLFYTVEDTNNTPDLIHIESNGSGQNQPRRAMVDLDIDLAANQRVDILIEIQADEAAPPLVQVVTAGSLPVKNRAIPRLPRLPSLTMPVIALKGIAIDAQMLFGFALGIYLVTQLVQLPAFPIYFFCDEAVNPVLASDFIRDGFRNYDGVFFPTFFKNGGQYCLGTSVYLQAIPYVLFGKSIWITRGFFVLLSALTAVFLAFILRDIYKNRYWWSAPLWLAAIPTWFLHARGAFEYAPMVTFYAGFLYFYLRYRTGSLRMLYLALVCGALAFYTYAPGQLIVIVSGLLLLIFDWRYHLQHWRVAVRGFAVLIVLAAPLVRFWMSMPNEYVDRLTMYDSYWTADITNIEKIGQYLRIYVSGLNPLYWFFPHSYDSPLHTMKGYGHIHWMMLPPFLYGLWKALRRRKEAEIQVVFVAMLAAPAGAAMAMLHANRALTIVLPVIILAVMGFSAGVEWLDKRKSIRQEMVVAAMTMLIVAFSLFMTADALTRGPTWYTNYELGGMQWGARQVFAAAKTYVQRFPDRTLIISPNWTFQSEVVRNFFVPGEERIRMGTADATIERVDASLNQKAFVLMPDEYQRVITSERFQEPLVDQIIQYPNGQPGFYFVRLEYRDNIEEVIQAQFEDRHRLHEAELSIDGQQTIVKFTAVEGNIISLFDDDPATLVKTQGINPMVVELIFDEPVSLQGVSARVGSEKVRITVEIMGEEPQRSYTVEAGEQGPHKDVPVFFDPVEVSHLRFTLLDIGKPDTNIVHLWGISLNFGP
jgi:hypothetical protein